MGSSDRSPRGLRKVAVSATGREGGSSPGLPAESGNGRFSNGLEEGRAALGAAIGRAMHRLAIEVLKLEEGQQPDTATSACFDIISVAASHLLSLLADVHHAEVQDKLRAQQTSFDLKLATQRAAASRELLNQSAELEAAARKRSQEEVELAMGDAAGLLRDAQRKADGLQAELNELKMRNEGTVEALTMAQHLNKASEARSAQLESEMEDVRGLAAAAQSENEELEARIKVMQQSVSKALAQMAMGPVGGSLEAQLYHLLEVSAAKHHELEEARQTLKDALKELKVPQTLLREALAELDVALDENESLKDQNEELKDQIGGHQSTVKAQLDALVGAAKDANAKKEAAQEKARMLQDAVVRLDAKLKEIEASNRSALARAEEETRALQAQLDMLRGEGSEAERLEKELAALRAELDRAFADLNIVQSEKATLAQRIKALVSDTEATRRENRELHARVEAAAEESRRLRRQVEEMMNADNGGDARMASIRENVAKANLLLRGALNSGGASSHEGPPGTPAAGEGTGGGAAAGRRSPGVPTAAGRGSPGVTTLPETDLIRNVERLIGRMNELEDALGAMKQELETASNAMRGLKDQMERVDEVVGIRVQEVQDAARRERQTLVTTALSSIGHLRSHLIYALSGLREVNASPTNAAESRGHPSEVDVQCALGALTGVPLSVGGSQPASWSRRPRQANLANPSLMSPEEQHRLKVDRHLHECYHPIPIVDTEQLAPRLRVPKALTRNGPRIQSRSPRGLPTTLVCAAAKVPEAGGLSARAHGFLGEVQSHPHHEPNQFHPHTSLPSSPRSLAPLKVALPPSPPHPTPNITPNHQRRWSGPGPTESMLSGVIQARSVSPSRERPIRPLPYSSPAAPGLSGLPLQIPRPPPSAPLDSVYM